MNQSYTKHEHAHIDRVRSLPCSVCDMPGPSEAHHISQDNPWTAVALCTDCHRHPKDGWHGQRLIWKVKKMVEIDALGVTIKRLMT
ncbi:conserved hypothetical protein [Sideroxydans lithotrophicus ES-1]|uniref:Uncharacterized protein n=1 Tax=Sideroxydans lithotrophicus (strain ES-1) TaxID=580332 RepID=D5CT76_SIDLE|nr:conserved hypothetical protein [Sideroxydans lithotrophicus ES-1]